jgi:curved DNA-binding protein CbpA
MNGTFFFHFSGFNVTDEKDFYKLLNINANATQQEIREAYKRRAREFHPDKNTADTTRIFQAMKLAYETLYDEERRMEYNADTDFDRDDDDENADEIFSTAKDDQMR